MSGVVQSRTRAWLLRLGHRPVTKGNLGAKPKQTWDLLGRLGMGKAGSFPRDDEGEKRQSGTFVARGCASSRLIEAPTLCTLPAVVY